MQLLGLFGHPVDHSLSPVMHKAAIKALGLNEEFIYLAFDISPSSLSEAASALRVLDFRGVNITIPLKEKIIPFLDRLDGPARLMGAVNVIVNERGCLTGFNTDGRGFLRSLEENTEMKPEKLKVLIFGAGGAARAVAMALGLAGVKEIVIINRNPDRAVRVAGMLNELGITVKAYGNVPKDIKKEIKTADLIVNTTSVGMVSNPGSLIEGYVSFLNRKQVVCDIIYQPLETLFIKQARANGCHVVSGLDMLLYQGAEAFHLWTGQEAPVDIMREALEENLKENKI
ncbi:MAG: shikimate dehydrogenase [Bacillota bacterium]|jgi:shikimate dehydrogenase